MTVTNIFNLPTALVEAVTTERHNNDGEYSATTLLKGACETILTKRHWDEILVDVSESIWQVFGTAVHSIMEAQKDNTFKEEFFSVDVSNSKVTGRVDSYDLENEVLVDWKTASVWKVIKQDFTDWKRQGLIYAWLMKKCGLTVKKCRFVALLKDQTMGEAKKRLRSNPNISLSIFTPERPIDCEYPPFPIAVYEFDVTDNDLTDIEAFIEARVKALEFADTLKDEELTPCSTEERWCTPEKWAHMKEGRKSAIKLYDTEEEAAKVELKKDEYIEHRPGENKKCDNYCNCKEWCPLFRKEVTEC